MSVAEMQACLARLYVDDAFRKLFAIDSPEALVGYGLTEEEAEAVKNVDRPMIEFFARSLVQKRKSKLLRAYPSLLSIKSKQIDRLYQRFCQLHPSQPHHPPSQEVVDFGIFMEQSLYRAEDVPPYASNLARYERCYYLAKFVEPGEGAPPSDDGAPISRDAFPAKQRGVQAVRFQFNVARIDEVLRENGTPGGEDLQEGEYLIVFQPAATPPGPRTFRVTLPTLAVLDFCDGSRTVSEIIRLTEQRFQTVGLGDRVLEMLEQLGARQLIRLDVRR